MSSVEKAASKGKEGRRGTAEEELEVEEERKMNSSARKWNGGAEVADF
jgi:hypothetical protein